MTLTTPPNNLQNGSYASLFDRLNAQSVIRSGGVFASGDCTVAQAGTPAMSVVVAIGAVAVLGSGAGSGAVSIYETYNDAAATVTITNSDPTNPRIDLLCVTVRDSFYTGAFDDVRFVVVAGTPAGSPTVPAVPNNSIPLAQIAVGAAATSIVNANITDRRAIVQASFPRRGYQTIATAAGTTVLTAASPRTTVFTGSTTQIVTLPDVTTLDLNDWDYEIPNKSTGIVTVNSSGGNLVYAIPANTTAIFRCILITGTTAASWSFDWAGASAAPVASGFVPIGSPLVLGTDQGSVLISGIPATYTNLRLEFTLRLTGAATDQTLGLRVNADAGANYDTERMTGTGASAGAVETFGGAQIVLAQNAVANSAGAGLATSGVIEIPNYANTTWNKNILARLFSKFGTGASNMKTDVVGASWRSSAAINSLTITNVSGSNIQAGSIFTLYGEA